MESVIHGALFEAGNDINGFVTTHEQSPGESVGIW